MGLFDRKKEGGIIDDIRCDETHYLIWKWRPSGTANSTKKENSIRYGSSLRVKKGEVAVFVYHQSSGQLMDYLVGPYDGTIKTSNFPVLTSIVGSAFGGNSPFQAEIYYINTQGNNQIKFAVPYFNVFDPRLPDHPILVSLHGTLTFTLEDYENFISLNRMIDFDLDAFYSQIKDAMARKIKSVVANFPNKYGIPAIQLEAQTEPVAEILEDKLRDKLLEFGVTMKGIEIGSININQDDAGYQELRSLTAGITADTIRTQSEINSQNLKDAAELNKINLSETMRIQREEVQRAQKLQSETNFLGAHALNQQTEVLKTAAAGLGQMNMNISGGSNDSGFNPAGLMMGMALGGSMGGQINNMMNQMGQQMNSSMTTPPPLPQVQYMLAENGQQYGPFTMEQMKQLVANGRMTKLTYAWKQGMSGWEPAGNITELSILFAPAGPPPVPGCTPPPPPPAM